MRITPLDVRKQEFRRSVRGFDCDEVRAFMATLADEYEIVLVDNKQIREKVMLQDEKISEYKTMERTLRDTLMTAEKLMQETRENADKEGELIVRDAKLQAQQILQECRLRTEELRQEIQGLRKEKENYLGRFKSLAESQIQFIESHRTDFKDLDDRLTGIVDSVVQGMVTSANEAKKEAVVETIVDSMIQPEHPDPREIAAPAANVASSANSEVDVWRSYNPASTGNAPQPTPESDHPVSGREPVQENARQADDWAPDGQDQAEQTEQTEQTDQQDQQEQHQPQDQESGSEEVKSDHQESIEERVFTETSNI